MGICASKDATANVAAKEDNVDSNGVELKETNPNTSDSLALEKNTPMEKSDGDGVEEAGPTSTTNVSRSKYHTSSNFELPCQHHEETFLGHFRPLCWIC